MRFHAFQSIFFHVLWIGFWIAWTIIGIVLGAVSHGLFFIIQVPVHLLIWLGGFCIWLYLMYTAYQGKMVQLPVIGPLAAKASRRLEPSQPRQLKPYESGENGVPHILKRCGSNRRFRLSVVVDPHLKSEMWGTRFRYMS